jgi:hypothetical protein
MIFPKIKVAKAVLLWRLGIRNRYVRNGATAFTPKGWTYAAAPQSKTEKRHPWHRSLKEKHQLTADASREHKGVSKPQPA